MLRSYVLTALRFFRRQKGYTALNVIGLGIGLAGAFFILLWVQDELRFDRFHERADELYQVRRHMHFTDGSIVTATSVTKPAAEVLEAEHAEVEHAEVVTFQQEAVLARGDLAFREEGHWAEPAFFEMFSFPLLAGDPATALDAPDGIVISERVARAFFGEGGVQEALGQIVRVDDRADFRVTGVAAEVPDYSTLQFDWVLPFADYYARNEWLDHWGNSGAMIFVQLRAGADPAALNEQIEYLIPRHREEGDDDKTQIFLQPFGDVHLYGRFQNGQQAGGRIAFVRVFGIIAVFLVLIACVNFMNLATARAAQRAREIGVRKTMGAGRWSLAGQFLAEAVLVALGAFVLAAGVVLAALPLFREVSGRSLALGSLGWEPWAGFLGLSVVAGLLAGAYPALVLSGFDAAGVLRGGGVARGSALLRKGLVVFQFAASVLLIFGTLVVYQQLRYIQTTHTGIDRENVVSMTLEGGAREQYGAFKQALLASPGVEAVTAANNLPFRIGNSTTDPVWEGKDPESQLLFHVIQGDYGFVEAMKMELAAGRTFAPEFGADTSNFVVNRKAAEVMGMDAPVGEALSMWGRDGQIVGVVEDFHMASLHEEIEPTIILLDAEQSQSWLLLVRLAAGQTPAGLAHLRETFQAFNPGYPFDYEFLDAAYGEMYEGEQRVGTLAALFAALAALVACLGLFGLAAYAAERRRKEVGVRKVLGASVPGLVGLLSREFVVLVLVACAIALPLGYWAMEQVLSVFAYRVTLGVGPFLVAALVALGLAAATVSTQALRAATADPVRALHHD